MAATKDTAADEALVRILEDVADRVQRVERAIGQLAALQHGVSGSERVTALMPELGELLRRHEDSGRYPRRTGE